MLLIRCVNAYSAVGSMMDKEWDYPTAHALMLLKKKLQPHVDFYSEEEMKLVQEYAQKDEKGEVTWKGNGSFSFRDPKAAEKYNRKIKELGAVEVEKEFVPVKATAPQSIQPVILEALDGFVEFVEDDK